MPSEPSKLSTPSSVKSDRKATAYEIVKAADSGQVPEWFSDEERKAVERVKS